MNTWYLKDIALTQVLAIVSMVPSGGRGLDSVSMRHGSSKVKRTYRSDSFGGGYGHCDWVASSGCTGNDRTAGGSSHRSGSLGAVARPTRADGNSLSLAES